MGDPLKVRLDNRVIAFAEVSWYTSAVPLLLKLFSSRLTGVLPDRYLLMIMTVRAPSELRCAANTATLSGLGPPAETLTSPNADRLPSQFRYILMALYVGVEASGVVQRAARFRPSRPKIPKMSACVVAPLIWASAPQLYSVMPMGVPAS